MIGAPLAGGLLTFMPWQSVFVTFAGLILLSLLVLPLMRAPARATKAELIESMGIIVTRAFRDPSYTLIFLDSFSAAIRLGSSPRMSRPLQLKSAA